MGALFGRERRQAFPEPPISPTYQGVGGDGYDTTSGMAPTSSGFDPALTVPAVWACVSLLANSVSTLPLEAYRRDGSGIPSRLATQPPLLTSPAAGLTQSEWLHMVMVSLLLRGNAFGKIVARDGMQFPTQIELMNPDMVEVKRQDGRLLYLYGTGSNRVEVPLADVWHVRGMCRPGDIAGLSPISYAAPMTQLDLMSRKFAGDFFAGGGMPKGVFVSEDRIDGNEARTLKERFLAVTRNREPLVIGRGFTYTKLGVSPDESQFLATQKANVDQIARYFNVPATMVGGSAGGSMTYTSVEMQGIHFLTYSLSYWLKRLEDAVFGLLPESQYVRFTTDALLRTDAETQAKIDVQLLAGKVVTPTEVRARRDMPPMTDAQKAEADLVPLTITPLGGAKALPGEKTPPGPPAPVPADDQQEAPSAA